jgi:hypothetical protein
VREIAAEAEPAATGSAPVESESASDDERSEAVAGDPEAPGDIAAPPAASAAEPLQVGETGANDGSESGSQDAKTDTLRAI